MMNAHEDKSLAHVKKIVEQIVKTIVRKSDQVHVEIESKADGAQFLAIRVDEQDRGKVIGKNGQTIKSIRSFIQAINPGKKHIDIDVSM